MITSGFFDSLNGDRKYTALQMGEIYDGIIQDGIIPDYGESLKVTANNTNVEVGSGRAFFDHLWLKNDERLSLSVPESDQILDRIDSVVLDYDRSIAVRAANIYVIQGVASSKPVPPEIINISDHKQYPLAFIHRHAGVNTVLPSDIIDCRGSEYTPFSIALIRGQDGLDGQNGKSAYEYAVNGGYSGTETEFYNDISSLANKQDKPAQITSGTTITLEDNTEYVLTNVSSLNIAYPPGNFECWLKITTTTSTSGSVSITLPTSTYIGAKPTFAKSETWELSIRNGVVIAGKAVSA